MLKRTAIVMIAALMICAAAAGCSTASDSTSSTVSTKMSASDSVSSSEDSSSADTDENSISNSDRVSSIFADDGSSSSGDSDDEDNTSSDNDETVATSYNGSSDGIVDTSDLFSERDLLQTPDLSSAKTITATDNKTETITTAGIYVVSGSASNFTIKVEAGDEDKVQIVLDEATITNTSTPVIYVVNADKCFVTTNGNTSILSVTETFTSDGTTNTDAVIFSKDDIVLNGTGTLVISSANGNGISGKDDIKITGGTYQITSAEDAIEANETILVCGGTFTINSTKDGLHAENDDDLTTGIIYIGAGTFDITASSDGIQSNTAVQIDGGEININSGEGIESTYVQINGGTVNISATDDGINASEKSTAYSTPTVEIKDGSLTITMSGGDVDCIDSNGNIIVSGGTINVSYPTQGPSESFDCAGTATYTGGTIIINGTQVDSIPQSAMGGGMGGPGDMGGMGGMNNFRR